MSKPQEAKTPEELIESLKACDDVITFVPRKLLIQAIGAEEALQFLPALPDFVSINVIQFINVQRRIEAENAIHHN